MAGCKHQKRLTPEEAKVRLLSSASESSSPSRDFLRDHPGAAVALAVGAGVLFVISPPARKVVGTALASRALRELL